MLTSTRSPHVARLRRLHERKGREQSGTFLAEGPDCVEAAIQSGLVREIVTTPGHPIALRAGEAGVDVHLADARVVSAICDAKSPQGIVAECAIPATSLTQAIAGRGPIIVCDRLADPGNLGTIIRTAEAVGACAVLTVQGSVDPWNPKVVRASAGSIFRLPVVQVESATDGVDVVKATGRPVLALSGTADSTVSQALDALRQSGADLAHVAWLVGSEAHGISPAALEASTYRVRLPMRAAVESLNAAIAVAICLYLAAGDSIADS